jgi:hypothetical protein
LNVKAPAAVTVAVAPPLVIAPPGLALTTVVPAKVVLSVPAVAGLPASQVTLAEFSPAHAASALRGLLAMTLMNAPVKAVVASSAAAPLRLGLGLAAIFRDSPKPRTADPEWHGSWWK